MRQVKLFKGVESELAALEHDINQWISEAGVEVLSISGNISPQSAFQSPSETFSASDILVIVTYEAQHGG